MSTFPTEPTVVYVPCDYAEAHSAAILDAIADSATPWAIITEEDVVPNEDLVRKIRDITVHLEKSTPTIRLIESFEDRPSEQRNVMATLITQAMWKITKGQSATTTALPPRDLLPVVVLWLLWQVSS